MVEKQKKQPKKNDNLRQRAEKLMRQSGLDTASLTREEIERQAHELAVHQIELEIQNQDLRQTQQELLQARDRYADLYNFAPVGYVTLDKHNIIADANLTICQMLGVDRAALIKQRLAKFVSLESQDSFYFYLQRLRRSLERSKENGEARLIKADPAGSFYARLEGLRSEDGLHIAIIDISDIKQAEENIENLNQSLMQGKVELENANKELRDMEFAIIQDLKASYRQINSFGQALAEDCSDILDKEDQDYLRRIRNISQGMRQYLDDLVKLAGITTADLVYEKVDLSRMADNITQKLKSIQPERDIKIIIEPNLKAQGDPQLLNLALENLLENAFKFTSKRAQTEITFGVTHIQDQATYFIKDNGIGFDMQYANRLFIPFQRLHSQKDFSGTGIGLAIVQRVIHRHGGKVWAEALPGRGATFYFTVGKERKNEPYRPHKSRNLHT